MSITHIARCGMDGTDMKTRIRTVFTIDTPARVVPCPRMKDGNRCTGGWAPRWDAVEVNHMQMAVCPECHCEFFFKLACMQPTLETFVTPHGVY